MSGLVCLKLQSGLSGIWSNAWFGKGIWFLDRVRVVMFPFSAWIDMGPGPGLGPQPSSAMPQKTSAKVQANIRARMRLRETGETGD
jgi:hypothetical protein